MVNKRIKIAIIESGQKGYELARGLGWHPSKVSQIIIGAYRPSFAEKRVLATALGKTVDQLFSKENF